MLCKTIHIKEYSYSKVLETLELLVREGVIVQSLGSNVKGAVLCVSADNFGVHSLVKWTARFWERSVRVHEICLVDSCISFIIELFTAGFLENLRCYQFT